MNKQVRVLGGAINKMTGRFNNFIFNYLFDTIQKCKCLKINIFCINILMLVKIIVALMSKLT